MLLLKTQVTSLSNNNIMLSYRKNKKGFTLIEIMVSISVFSVVMLIFSGSIYSAFEGNRKSRSLRAVMDNLNLSLESMTRNIRFGSRYHCDINQGGGLDTTRDCVNGATSIAVLDSDGNQVVYRLNGSRIVRSVNGGAEQYVTSPDVWIEALTFYVLGSTSYSAGGDLVQPRVVILIRGRAGNGVLNRTQFSLQTTISQRAFDSQ